MSTETPTQSLTERVESEKASVEEAKSYGKGGYMTPLAIVGVVAFVVLLGFLAVQLFMNSDGSADKAEQKTQQKKAGGNAEPAPVDSKTAEQQKKNGSSNGEKQPIGAATVTKAATVVADNGDAQRPLKAVPGIQVKNTEPVSVEAEAVPEEPPTAKDLADDTVPWWQREFAKLPAMDVCEHGKYTEQPYPYEKSNPMYDAQAYNNLESDPCASKKNDNLYTVATQAQGDSASEIYARARPNGIALLNRGAIRDPHKMLPTAKSGDEKLRKFQVGASIADIQKHLPKTTDLMKMARDRPSGLSFQIPLEKPPLYTEGINCERRARIPTRASDKNQLFCINPIEPREYYDYRPHPLLDSVLADGGRFPQGGGFAGDAPNTGSPFTASAESASAAAASGTPVA